MNTKLILPLAAVIALGLWYALPQSDDADSVPQYRTERVTLGNINNTVSATGTLAAVDDVVVGAQLSGQITEVLVDFNDAVTQGQLLARIDPRTFAAQAAQAQANVAKVQADLGLQAIAIQQAQTNLIQARRDHARLQRLTRDKLASQDELDTAQTNLELAQLGVAQADAQLTVLEASLAASQASLAQAQVQLDRTEIRAPIDGFVINRTIEAGQTVASSYNTPELFTLARDLGAMEIEAYIDESDIGQIALDQGVQFTVDAFPERRFRGRITQIQKAPQTSAGVISYTVIVDAPNPQGLLLPGMTANLEVNIDAVRDVQRVSNAALRIASRLANKDGDNPKRRGGMLEQLDLTDAQRQQLQAQLPKNDMGPGKGARAQRQQRMEKALASVLTAEQQQRLDRLRSGELRLGQLMVLEQGQAMPLNVELGISDDQHTEIRQPDLTGLTIINQVKVRL